MAGTNAVAARQAVIAKIRALEIPAAGGGTVQVAYAWPGNAAEREVVHGSNPVTFDQAPAAFRGGGRCPRDEEVTVPVCVVVRALGGDVEETDVRAAEIGTVIEEDVAADPTLADAPNLKLARIDGGDLVHDFDDDGAVSVLTYHFILRSRLD